MPKVHSEAIKFTVLRKGVTVSQVFSLVETPDHVEQDISLTMTSDNSQNPLVITFQKAEVEVVKELLENYLKCGTTLNEQQRNFR